MIGQLRSGAFHASAERLMTRIVRILSWSLQRAPGFGLVGCPSLFVQAPFRGFALFPLPCWGFWHFCLHLCVERSLWLSVFVCSVFFLLAIWPRSGLSCPIL